ncbi:MAG: helix-turn-helix domain-containing protein [Desulfovermiculus sp.]
MKIQHVTIDPDSSSLSNLGRIDPDRVDATTEEDITLQIAADEAEALQDAAKFARRVRKRLGLTQEEFSVRIGVSVNTVRNWEQGKRRPTGTAQSLLKVLDKSPETSLAALE